MELRWAYKGSDRKHGKAKIVQLIEAWRRNTEVHHYYNIQAEVYLSPLCNLHKYRQLNLL